MTPPVLPPNLGFPKAADVWVPREMFPPDASRTAHNWSVIARLRPSVTLDEARTLRAFWNLLREFNVHRDVIIGHNILEFDLPFLEKRSVICGVPQTVHLSFARYRRQPIYDTLKEWTHWDYRRTISLVELGRILNIELTKMDGIDGGQVYDHFCAGCHDDIAHYCMRDVELVRAVYRRMCFEEQSTNDK